MSETHFQCMRNVRQAIAGMKAHPCMGDVGRLRELARQLREAAHSAEGAADGIVAEALFCKDDGQ